jgi:hypothetical protein
MGDSSVTYLNDGYELSQTTELVGFLHSTGSVTIERTDFRYNVITSTRTMDSLIYIANSQNIVLKSVEFWYNIYGQYGFITFATPQEPDITDLEVIDSKEYSVSHKAETVVFEDCTMSSTGTMFSEKRP